MRIRLRLIFTLALLLGLMGSQVFVTAGLVGHLTFTFRDISRKHLVQIERANRINDTLTAAAALSGMKSGKGFSSGISLRPADLKELEKLITTYTKDYEGSPEQLAHFQEAYERFSSNYLEFIRQTDSGNDPDNQTLQSLYSNVSLLLDASNRLRDADIQRVRDITANNHLIAKRTFFLLIIILSVVTVVVIIFGWNIATNFSKGIKALLAALETIARGDLSQPLKWDHPDEFKELAKAHNNMLDALVKSQQETARSHQQALEVREKIIRKLEDQVKKT